MKKTVLLSVASFALLLVAASTSNAQTEKPSRLPIYVRVFAEVFKPTPLNVGEDAQVEKRNREWEKQRREQREPKEPKEPAGNKREVDYDCTRHGRRDQ